MGVVLGLCLAVGTGVGALRWVDLPIATVAILQSLFPVAAAEVLAVSLLALVCRHARLALVGVVPSAVAVVLSGAALLPHTVDPGPTDLTVMSANLEFGGADAGALVRAATEHRVDVLVLVEVTPEAMSRLRAAGLDALLSRQAGSPQPGAVGTVVRSRFPVTLLGDGVLPGVESRVSFQQPVISVHGPTGPFTLRAVHVPAPVGFPRSWRQGLAALSEWTQAQPGDVPLVLAGDFNASSAHPAYRGLADLLTDAHRASGSGWVRTWPQDSPLPPFVQLDHVLVRGFGVVASGTVVLGGTDHAAVWATLR